MKIKSFTFNPFQENTFVISDNTKECIIIDPGCYEEFEKEELEGYIIEYNLNPVLLINTHCHIDHILGNQFIAERWGLELHMNENDLNLLNSSDEIASLYGFRNYQKSPSPSKFLKDKDNIYFGESQLEVLFTPGHSPGHISLFSKKENFVVSGDVIFQNSIGRTDLPGGNFEVLIESIQNKLLIMDETTNIYCGHGPKTTIGYEKLNNPFLK